MNPGEQRIRQSLGLLVDLLDHKMLIARLFGLGHIPVDGDRLFGRPGAISVINLNLVFFDDRHFVIVQEIYVPRIFQNCRNIRGDEILALADAHDERTVFAHGHNAVRLLHGDDAKSIGTLQHLHGLHDSGF